jgi:hypothetical protein
MGLKITILGIKIFGVKNRTKWYQYWLKKKQETPSIFAAGQKLSEYRYHSGLIFVMELKRFDDEFVRLGK